MYLEPPWRMHAGHHRLVAYPPDGYEFVVTQTPQEKVFEVVTRRNALRFILRSSDLFIPTGLVKSALERWNRPPAGTAFTYACDHLVFRREPWVVEVEFASLLAGRHPKHLKRFRGLISKGLSSPHCRKIICWSETGRRALVADLDARGFHHKIEVVPYTVPPKHVVKEYGCRRVKLIFVGADHLGSSWTAFEYKGGREVLATFAHLRREFSNLELVVRASVPPDVKARYGGMDSLRILEHHIPSDELDREYRSADICILPSHTTIPVTILEAMSYELPVVTVDSWANGEYVEDGRTGLVAPRSKRLPYYYPGTAQVNFGTPQYEQAMRRTDPDVVAELVQRVRVLIEGPELRSRLAKAGRYEVEHGRFSLARVNEKLKRVFDEAITGDGQPYHGG